MAYNKKATYIKMGLGAAAETAKQLGTVDSNTAQSVYQGLTKSTAGNLGAKITAGATAAAPVVAAKATAVAAAATAAAPVVAGAAVIGAIGYGCYKLFKD